MQLLHWLAQRLTVDFELDDALHKLLTLGLVREKEGLLHAVAVDEGIRLLDRRWDAYFVPDE